MRKQIVNYIRAGYPGLYILSHEESRVESELKAAAKETKFKLHAWTCTKGVFECATGAVQNADALDPMIMLDEFDKLPDKSILVAEDLHGFLKDAPPMLVRRLKESLATGKTANRVLVILGCVLELPPELEKELTVIEFALPDRETLRKVAENIATSAGQVLNGNTDALLDAAGGLTTTEAENAFALSVIESKALTPAIVSREKAATLKKNGVLEIIDSGIRVEDIGGLENLKADLISKRGLFGREAREYGLPTPRGVLIVGQPGTGKTLTATATRGIFNIPLLRLDAGRLFGSLVGESERNWRSAFATAKAIAPCILWIDEVDGLFSGARSSGQSDGGTTARVVKSILQDMQLNGEGIFFCFTANDIDGLPDPLIDRLDVWSVDLPSFVERVEIWKIHIARRKRDPKDFDLKQLAKLTDGFSGRQIEQLWLKAMTIGFNAERREPTDLDVATVATQFVPTSRTMAEVIEARRKRLAGKAQPASNVEQSENRMRKLVA